MLWWNFFSVLDVLLLFTYDQLRDELGAKVIFHINNIIWFLGLDLFHLYFTIALWSQDIPSIKEVPRRTVFYATKPTTLEPRRPKLENKDDFIESRKYEDQNLDMIDVLFEEINYDSDETTDSWDSPQHCWNNKKRGSWGLLSRKRASGQGESSKAVKKQDGPSTKSLTNMIKRASLPRVSS